MKIWVCLLDIENEGVKASINRIQQELLLIYPSILCNKNFTG